MQQQLKVTFGNKQNVIITQLYFQGTKYRVFQSTECNFVVKVYDVGQEKYLNTELQAVHIFKEYYSPNIVKGFEGELQLNQKVIVFEKGDVLQNILKDQQKGLEETQILKILLDLSRALKHCHALGITHRDIRPENVMIGMDKQAKLWNFQRCSFQVKEIVIQQYEHLPTEYLGKIKEELECNTFEHVRAPEQKDLSQRMPITTKVDIYALGQLMYYILFKVRYDQNQNWETNPKWGVYSNKLQQLVRCLLNPNPTERFSAEQTEQYINQFLIQQNQIPQQLHVRSVSSNERANKQMKIQNGQQDKYPQIEFVDVQHPQSSLTVQIVKLMGKVAQKTDCWVAACLEEVDSPPNQKYFRYLHGKAWQKKQKIPKFYEKLSNRLQLNSVIITFKGLLLIHNYIKKGPQETLIVNDKNYSPLAILERIKQFQISSTVKTSKDKFRSIFLNNMLFNYAHILIEKVKFLLYYKQFFEGNYAMVPFFNSLNNSSKPKISLAMLSNLMNFWKQLNLFIQPLFQENSLINLQLGLAITMADEMYNILCTCIHIFYAIKQSTNYTSGLQANGNEVKQHLLQLQEDCEFNFQQTCHFFNQLKMIPQFQQMIPDPSKNVIETIKQIPLFQQSVGDFNIYDFLGYSMSIEGLKLPQSYGEVMITSVIEYDDEVVELEARNEKYCTYYPIKPVLSCQPITERRNKFIFDEEKPKTNSAIQSSQPLSELQTLGINQNQSTSLPQVQNIENKPNSAIEFAVEQKKKQTKQQQQGEYQGLELSDDEDDDTEHLHHQPNDQQTTTKAQLEDKNVKLSIELVQDKEFLNWSGQNGQTKRIQSAHSNNNFADIKFPVAQETQRLSNGNIFDQFNQKQNYYPQQQPQQQQQQQLQPHQQQQQQQPNDLARQNSTNGFYVVDYFIKQGKNVADMMIDFEQLKLDRQIGTGSSCEVFKGYWRGGEVAIKKMKIKSLSENHLKEFRREISALVSIKTHPNLVQLMGISQKDDELYIVTEFCAGGTLFDLLHRKKNIELSWPVRIKMAIQIAQGMLHLHDLTPPLIHRDLKSLNLLLESTFDFNKINIKIADFGLARVQADNGEQMTGILGTFHWMAPEVFENIPYTIKADIFSYSIVLWEICCRETPYKSFSTNPHAIMRYVTIDKGRPDLNLLQPGCPSYLKELMMKCWDQDPSKRPSFLEIIQYLKRFQ